MIGSDWMIAACRCSARRSSCSARSRSALARRFSSSSACSCCALRSISFGLGEQVDEHRDLGAKHDRIDRLEHIVDRAHRIAAHQMLGFLVDRRQEDDRDALGLLARADDLGGLVAVHPGHVDVEQDDRELAPEQLAQRFLARIGDDHLADFLEHGRDREQVALVIVDDQHARAIERRVRRAGAAVGKQLRLRLANGWAHVHFIPLRQPSWSVPPPPSRDRATHTRSSASSRSMSTGLAI